MSNANEYSPPIGWDGSKMVEWDPATMTRVVPDDNRTERSRRIDSGLFGKPRPAGSKLSRLAREGRIGKSGRG
jgi:hypothetical protein